MAKTLSKRYEELSAEVDRLNALRAIAARKEEKAWAVCSRWEGIARKHGRESRKCQIAIRQVAAEREAIVGRLMKGDGSKWLPPAKAPVAYFEEDAR